MKPLRPLFILQDLRGGGAERVVLNLLRHLDPSRFAPTLLLVKGDGQYWDEVPPSVTVRAGIPARRRVRSGFPRLVRELASLGRESDVVVGALELDPTYAAFACSRLCRRPLVAWVHVHMERFLGIMPPRHRRLVPAVYSRVPTVVVPAAGVGASLGAIVPAVAGRVRVIPNPLDLDEVRRRAEEPLEPELEPVFRRPTVVALGRLAYQKGLDVLLRAHALLRAGGPATNLLILGEGPERGALERLARELGVGDSVFMAGFRSNPYPALRRARAFALSSRFEGFGMVIGEAMSLGVPTVVTDCPAGHADVVEGGRHGMLVPPEDPAALARALGQLLSDDEIAHRLATAGERRAADFAPGVVVPAWERLLLDAAGRT